MENEIIVPALKCLASSWLDINYDWNGLTSNEKALITPKEFEEVVQLMQDLEIIS